MDLQTLLLIVITLLLGTIAGLIFSKQRKDLSGEIFAVAVTAAAVWASLSLVTHLSKSIEVITLTTRISYGMALVAMLSLAVFSETFPAIKHGAKKRIAVYVSIATIVGFLTVASDSMIVTATPRSGNTPEGAIFGTLFPLYAIVGISYLVILVAGLIISMRNAKGVHANQMKYILYGTSASVAIGMLSAVILPLAGITTVGYLAPFASVIAIWSIYYAIFRHRFLDLRLFFSYAIEFTFLIAVAYIFFYGIMYVDNTLLGGVYSQDALIAGVFFASVFIAAMQAIMHLVNKYFIEPRFNYQSISISLNKLLGSCLDKHALSEIFAKFIKQKIDIENVSVIKVSDDRRRKWELLHGKEIDLHLFKAAVDYVGGISHTTVREELPAKRGISYARLYAFMNEAKIEIIVPISQNDTHYGYILCDSKKSGTGFSIQELQLIENLSVPFSFALQRAVLHDVTQQFNLRLQEEVAKATVELKQKYQQERDMIGILGHELRTPLTVAKNMTELMESKLEKMKENHQVDYDYLLNKTETIHESLEKETDIVETALSTSRVDNGKISVHLGSVDLLAIIDYTMRVYQPQATEKGLQLTFERPSFNLPLLLSDSAKLQEVLTNFVSNAIKYSDKGYVKIYLKKESQMLHICVEDSGKGIPSESLKKLGEKFYRVDQYIGDNNEVIRPGGTGLGLYVVKGYAAALGGELQVDSKLGKGSTFSFIIPLRIAGTSETSSIKEESQEAQDMFEKMGLSRR